MALKLGQLDEADRLAAIVSSVSEKVLAQRPGDLRAMRNLYFSSNVLAEVARGRHDLADAKMHFAKAAEYADNYVRFNPADGLGWFSRGNALRDEALTAYDLGRVAEGTAKLRETVGLEHDPRNKTGVNFQMFISWRNLVMMEAQRGNLPEARKAIEESARTADALLKLSGLDEEVVAYSHLEREQMYEVDVLAVEGNYTAVHQRAVAFADQLARIKVVSRGNQNMRIDGLRRARFWQIESALRLGNFEEAVNAARAFVDQPMMGSLEKLDQLHIMARAKARLGEALVGAGRREEARAVLDESLAYYRGERAKGAADTQFLGEIGRALYVQASAQGMDAAGRANRRALLEEAAAHLRSLTFEAQQLASNRELIQWVAAAQAESGPAGT